MPQTRLSPEGLIMNMKKVKHKKSKIDIEFFLCYLFEGFKEK